MKALKLSIECIFEFAFKIKHKSKKYTKYSFFRKSG